jgi:glyoxylase-like metal-dependent hydrolase (beta-lactamase superfamily II)
MEIVQLSLSAYHLRDPRTSLNVGCIVTPDGVILVDTGTSQQMAAAIRARIAEVTDQQVAYAINTHNGECALGNRHFEVPIIAHQGCYQAMERARAAQERELARGNGAEARNPDLLSLPTVSFSEDGYLYVGGVLLELLHAPGRSEGALAVHLPDEKVLFAGDNLNPDAYPLADADGEALTANPYRWIETLTRLRGLGATTIVASRGRVAGPADIDRQLEHLETIVASRESRMREAGLPAMPRNPSSRPSAVIAKG